MFRPFALLHRLREGVENRLFLGGEHGPQGVLALLAYPYAVLRDLASGQLTLRATGLVYATLLALIPALALSFAVLTALGIHRDLAPLIQEFLRPLGSQSTVLTARALEFADKVRGGVVGSIGLVVLLWTLIGTLRRVEDSFNFVWRVQRPRSFARRLAEYVVLLVAAPLLIVSVVAFTGLAIDIARQASPADVPLLSRLPALLIQLAPYAIVTALFTLLYVLIPNTRVRIVPALVGALCAGVLWAAVGRLFTALVIYTSRLTIVYAGFALVVAVVLWTYFGWLILLAGAQLAFYVQNPRYLALGHAPVQLSNRERERLALDVMTLLARAQVAGARPHTRASLAEALGLPSIAMAVVLDNLEDGGLLTVDRRERIRLGRDPEDITLVEIVETARHRRRAHRLLRVRASPEVTRLHEGMEDAVRAAFGDRRLSSLALPGAAAASPPP